MSDPYADSFDEIYGETEDEKRARGKANGPSRSAPLPFIDMSTWDTTPAPARQWLITDYVPLRQPTLLSGEGAIGKSILLLQLLASTPLSQPWIETLWPKPGPTLYLGAEDEQDEIRRRLEPILEHHDMRFSDLISGGFKALAYAGKDAVLAQFDRSGRIKPTDLFQQLYTAARDLKPSAIAIDTVSDVYLGDEIKREQVRQFGSLMRRLAIDTNSAVIIAAHPSQSGIKSGSGLSGSTQWHNTVRARAYFRKPAADDDDENDDEAPDTGLRELHFLKNQYGPLGRRIQLKWSNGLWLPPSATEDSKSIADQRIEQLFLVLLRRFTVQGRDVSSKQSPPYAPAKFAETPEAKRVKASRRKLTEAMERLFTASKIKIVTDGPPSRQRSRLVEVIKGSPQPKGGFPAVVVGPAPEGVPCVHCQILDDRPVLKIRDGRVPNGKPEVLHERCAEGWFKGDFHP